ncbi:class I SAM-dependent methyltransferase [Candidatus Woesearchaeota archaeon]|jgi:ubiquinone/menaquinone biosynthesis C-methylase UbiE|nr:class I SAM-dependent methyltransferase [Candidatus Woesearchaeota archaeon]MBT5740382.1 class I SAM-dependent methyltransferase [Candidatus Woesearchaeota archaeon]
MTKFIPAARFNFLTPLFDFFCRFFGLGKRYRKSLLRLIPIKSVNARVLDAGCGSGTLALELKEKYQGLRLYGLDADEKILGIAKRKSKEKNLAIHFRQGLMQKLPFPDNSFDLVYSSLVFHHLNSKDKQLALKEIYRVINKDGILFLADLGKPKNILTAPFSWFTIILEEGKDNYKGYLPIMLKQANFSEIEEVGRYKFNISFLKAVKN